MPNIPKPIVFWRASSTHTRLEFLALMALVLAPIGVIVWIWQSEAFFVADIDYVLGRLGPFFWVQAALLALVAVASIIIQWQIRHAVLILDSEGIRMEVPVAPARYLLRRRVAWRQLAQVSYLPSLRMIQLRPKGMLPLPWPIRVRDWRPDLLAELTGLGVFEAYPKGAHAIAAEFDLAKHPATRTAMVVLAVLVGYSLVDMALQREAWAFFDLDYCVPHIIAALAAALAVGAWLAGVKPQRVPGQVAAGLALITGVAAGIASYTGGLRINQAFGGPLVAAAYHRSADCLALEPVDQSLPVIEYTDLAKPYWCSMPASTTVPVRVRKGLFGLYQVNLTEHTDAIREFRASK